LEADKHQFLLIFAFGLASLVELMCLLQRLPLATVESFNDTGAVVSCSKSNARKVLSLLGGTTKLGMVLGKDLADAISQIELPAKSKFNWTVSGYGCGREAMLNIREQLHIHLKKEGLGKSKFLEPRLRDKRDSAAQIMEMDVSDLRDRVLWGEVQGLELMAFSEKESSQPLYAQTIDAVKVSEYEKRDFGRPYQDPRVTLSPRLARLLINCSLFQNDLIVLDPFCGLGTLLAEAMLLNCSVIGTDRSGEYVARCAKNLEWLAATFKVAKRFRIFGFDARRISEANIPGIGAIASEPILLPVYRKNPSPIEASTDLASAKATYDSCLNEFGKILSKKGSRLALFTPTVIDSSGAERPISMAETARDAGFRQYNPLASYRVTYPLKIESQKKKFVRRNLNIYELA
jgi:Putative RNA methylase family UPF0020